MTDGRPIPKLAKAAFWRPDEVPPASSTRKLAPLAKYNGKPCPYCHKTMMYGSRRRPTRDHVRPKCLGFTLNERNRLIVCSPCNHDKGSMSLEQFAHWLTERRDARAGIVWSLVDRFFRPRANGQLENPPSDYALR